MSIGGEAGSPTARDATAAAEAGGSGAARPEIAGPGGELERRLAELKASGRKILVIYLTGCLPDAAGCVSLMREAAEAGADLVELGIPFSDPVMDGPVIQEASRRALDRGTTPSDVIACAAEAALPVPVAVMTYFNPVFRRGLDRFAREAAKAGVGGAIIPDLPLEESAEWEAAAAAAGVAPILLAAPNASDPRLAEVCARSRGFVYGVSLLGVTGRRDQLSEFAGQIGGRLQALTSLPALVGIGVSTPAQAAEVAPHADGVIVGSAVVQRVLEAASAEVAARSAGRFIAELRSALDGGV